MVQILAGEKGEGKTKRLIEMANEVAKTSDGNVVYIDDDKRHMYDLSHKIRFVDTSNFKIKHYETLIGFVFGVISQNSDIQSIFIDGIHNIVGGVADEELNALITVIEKISENDNIDFTMSICGNIDTFPAKIKEHMI